MATSLRLLLAALLVVFAAAKISGLILGDSWQTLPAPARVAYALGGTGEGLLATFVLARRTAGVGALLTGSAFLGSAAARLLRLQVVGLDAPCQCLGPVPLTNGMALVASGVTVLLAGVVLRSISRAPADPAPGI